MKIRIILLLLLGQALAAQVQMPTLSGRPIDWQADRFLGRDKFGYLYLIRDREFVKVLGAQQAGFQKPELGRISRADILNPLLPMLFYRDFNTVVMLDSQLNEVRSVNFTELQQKGLTIVAEAAGIASMNRLWIYDGLARQLGLFDYNRNVFTPVGNPQQKNIIAYTTDYNRFTWIDEDRKMYSSDVFGKTASVGGVPEFEAVIFLSEQEIIYRKGDALTYLNVSSGAEKSLPVVDKSFDAFFYGDQNLSIFTKQAISNYKITLP